MLNNESDRLSSHILVTNATHYFDTLVTFDAIQYRRSLLLHLLLVPHCNFHWGFKRSICKIESPLQYFPSYLTNKRGGVDLRSTLEHSSYNIYHNITQPMSCVRGPGSRTLKNKDSESWNPTNNQIEFEVSAIECNSSAE